MKKPTVSHYTPSMAHDIALGFKHMKTLMETHAINHIFTILVFALVASLLIGCTSTAETVTESVLDNTEPTRAIFDPANFVDPTTSTNIYHPLRPGLQWVRGGTTEVGSREVPYQVISTMTDVIRIIDGVPCVAMLDQSTDSGEIAQVGIDYFALDKDGNVWLMGGYSEDYESGQYTNVELAWLGSESGATTGILLPSNVTMATPRWYIGQVDEDEDPTVAEPVFVGIETSVSFGDFENVIAIREGEVDAIDNEIKYYAPEVGVILNVPQLESLHQDSFELINFIELSPDGLTEASEFVLALEEHAREVADEVYDESVPLAERRQ